MNIVTVTSVAGDLNCMNLLQNYVDKVPRDIFIVSFFFITVTNGNNLNTHQLGTGYIIIYLCHVYSLAFKKNEVDLIDRHGRHSIQIRRRKRQPTPVLLPGESQGRGSLVGCGLWGHTESDTTEATQQQYGLSERKKKKSVDSIQYVFIDVINSYKLNNLTFILCFKG